MPPLTERRSARPVAHRAAAEGFAFEGGGDFGVAFAGFYADRAFVARGAVRAAVEVFAFFDGPTGEHRAGSSRLVQTDLFEARFFGLPAPTPPTLRTSPCPSRQGSRSRSRAPKRPCVGAAAPPSLWRRCGTA